MGDTNYISSIVKILEIPKYKTTKNNYVTTQCRVQLPQIRKSKVINLIVWGKLAKDVMQYYQTNDYVLVEGFLSISSINLNLEYARKTPIFTAVKVYPFLLNSEN
jgi:single-stranded DNA-binding protein